MHEDRQSFRFLVDLQVSVAAHIREFIFISATGSRHRSKLTRRHPSLQHLVPGNWDPATRSSIQKPELPTRPEPPARGNWHLAPGPTCPPALVASFGEEPDPEPGTRNLLSCHAIFDAETVTSNRTRTPRTRHLAPSKNIHSSSYPPSKSRSVCRHCACRVRFSARQRSPR